MYKRHLNQINLLDEPEYFGGIALDSDNEWVKLAKLIPWHQFEEEYATSFPSGTGQPAILNSEDICLYIVLSDVRKTGRRPFH